MKARDNPFAAPRLEKLLHYDPSLIGESWESIFDKAETLGFRCAITGPHGSGKTTFLDAFQPRLEERDLQVTRIFVNDTEPFEPEVFQRSWSSKDVICLDGSEALSRIDWWRARRASAAGGGLIITTHSGTRLPTLLHLEPSVKVLTHCIRRSLGTDPGALLPPASVLLDQHQGNIRLALRECYDRMAEIPDSENGGEGGNRTRA